MKIRIKGNSLRFRLTKSDFVTLLSDMCIMEQSDFLSGTFVYGIRVTQDENLSADFRDGNMLLSLPVAMLLELMKTDKVGFKNDNGPVALLIEKDFTCLDNVEEDQSDNFPNPLIERETK